VNFSAFPKGIALGRQIGRFVQGLDQGMLHGQTPKKKG